MLRVVCQRLHAIVCGTPAGRLIYTGMGGKERSSAIARSKTRAQGQLSGMRKVGRPERLTSRPGTASTQVRTVRATVAGRFVLPRRARRSIDEVMGKDRTRSQAGFAEKMSGRDVR